MRYLCVLVAFTMVLVLVGSSYASSESFQLPLYTPITRTVELSKGDRLVGEFTITSIPVYQTGIDIGQAWSLSVTIYDPSYQIVLEFQKDTPWSHPMTSYHDSFNYTASQAGVYRMQFLFTSQYWASSVSGNPQATLTYDVAKPNTFGGMPLWSVLVLVGGVTAITAVTVTYFATKKSRAKHENAKA